MDTQIFALALSVAWMLFPFFFFRYCHNNKMIEIHFEHDLESQRIKQEHQFRMREIEEENGDSESWKRRRDDD